MLFPMISIDELKKGDKYFDSDGLKWKVTATSLESVLVESHDLERTDGHIYTDEIQADELVRIDQMYRQFVSGRCKKCAILFVWARRHRVKLKEALCTCGRPLTQTIPRLLDPHGKTAVFECPKTRPAAPRLSVAQTLKRGG